MSVSEWPGWRTRPAPECHGWTQLLSSYDWPVKTWFISLHIHPFQDNPNLAHTDRTLIGKCQCFSPRALHLVNGEGSDDVRFLVDDACFTSRVTQICLYLCETESSFSSLTDPLTFDFCLQQFSHSHNTLQITDNG